MSGSARVTRRLFYAGVALVLLVLIGREVVGGPHRVGPASLDHAGLAPRTLHGAVVYAPDELGLPIAIARLGRWLVVADAHLDPALHLLDASDGRRIAAFGRRGEGPGEFRAPRSVVPDPGRPDAFWLYDLELQRLTFVDLADSSWRRPASEVPTLRLASDALVTDPLFLPDGSGLTALGFFPDGRLGFFDPEGRQVGTGGPLPPVDREVPPHVLQHAYQGRMVSRPDGTLLAIGSRHAGRLEITSPRGDGVRVAAAPFDFTPRFEISVGSEGPMMTSGPDLRFGYVDVAATQDRIYALFSGRLRGAYRDRASLARHVHLFDWEGRLLEVWELDEDAFAIAAAEDGRTLHALRHHPVPAVVRYERKADREGPTGAPPARSPLPAAGRCGPSGPRVRGAGPRSAGTRPAAP